MTTTREAVRHALTGPIMSLSTPFLADGEIDYEGVRRIIDFTIEAGTRTIIMTYGDTLYSILSDEEIAGLTKFVVAHTAGRAMVVAAGGMWWTNKTVEFARYASEAGADILMVLPPDWAVSCTADTFVAHYRAVATEIPVMVVTNVFKQRPMTESLEVIRRLRDNVDGIWAVKDDLCGELGQRLSLLVHDRWAVFVSGTKRCCLDAVPYGCNGYMSVFILFCPAVTQDFWRAVRGEDHAATRKVIMQCDVPFWDFIRNSAGGPDAAVHGILELKGLAGRWRREPYYSLSHTEMEKLAAFLGRHGWL